MVHSFKVPKTEVIDIVHNVHLKKATNKRYGNKIPIPYSNVTLPPRPVTITDKEVGPTSFENTPENSDISSRNSYLILSNRSGDMKSKRQSNVKDVSKLDKNSTKGDI